MQEESLTFKCQCGIAQITASSCPPGCSVLGTLLNGRWHSNPQTAHVTWPVVRFDLIFYPMIVVIAFFIVLKKRGVLAPDSLLWRMFDAIGLALAIVPFGITLAVPFSCTVWDFILRRCSCCFSVNADGELIQSRYLRSKYHTETGLTPEQVTVAKLTTTPEYYPGLPKGNQRNTLALFTLFMSIVLLNAGLTNAECTTVNQAGLISVTCNGESEKTFSFGTKSVQLMGFQFYVLSAEVEQYITRGNFNLNVICQTNGYAPCPKGQSELTSTSFANNVPPPECNGFDFWGSDIACFSSGSAGCVEGCSVNEFVTYCGAVDSHGIVIGAFTPQTIFYDVLDPMSMSGGSNTFKFRNSGYDVKVSVPTMITDVNIELECDSKKCVVPIGTNTCPESILTGNPPGLTPDAWIANPSVFFGDGIVSRNIPTTLSSKAVAFCEGSGTGSEILPTIHYQCVPPIGFSPDGCADGYEPVEFDTGGFFNISGYNATVLSYAEIFNLLTGLPAPFTVLGCPSSKEFSYSLGVSYVSSSSRNMESLSTGLPLLKFPGNKTKVSCDSVSFVADTANNWIWATGTGNDAVLATIRCNCTAPSYIRCDGTKTFIGIAQSECCMCGQTQFCGFNVNPHNGGRNTTGITNVTRHNKWPWYELHSCSAWDYIPCELCKVTGCDGGGLFGDIACFLMQAVYFMLLIIVFFLIGKCIVERADRSCCTKTLS